MYSLVKSKFIAFTLLLSVLQPSIQLMAIPPDLWMGMGGPVTPEQAEAYEKVGNDILKGCSQIVRASKQALRAGGHALQTGGNWVGDRYKQRQDIPAPDMTIADFMKKYKDPEVRRKKFSQAMIRQPVTDGALSVSLYNNLDQISKMGVTILTLFTDTRLKMAQSSSALKEKATLKELMIYIFSNPENDGILDRIVDADTVPYSPGQARKLRFNRTVRNPLIRAAKSRAAQIASLAFILPISIAFGIRITRPISGKAEQLSATLFNGPMGWVERTFLDGDGRKASSDAQSQETQKLIDQLKALPQFSDNPTDLPDEQMKQFFEGIRNNFHQIWAIKTADKTGMRNSQEDGHEKLTYQHIHANIPYGWALDLSQKIEEREFAIQKRKFHGVDLSDADLKVFKAEQERDKEKLAAILVYVDVIRRGYHSFVDSENRDLLTIYQYTGYDQLVRLAGGQRRMAELYIQMFSSFIDLKIMEKAGMSPSQLPSPVQTIGSALANDGPPSNPSTPATSP